MLSHKNGKEVNYTIDWYMNNWNSILRAPLHSYENKMCHLCAQDFQASLKERAPPWCTDGGMRQAFSASRVGLGLQSIFLCLCASATCQYKYCLMCLIAAIKKIAR